MNGKKLILGTLLVTSLIQTTSVAHADNATAGGIVGGIFGAIAGSAFGGGRGKIAAVVVGAIAGSVVGSKIGANLDEADRRALGDAQNEALSGGMGQNCDWDGRRYGSRTDARGSFTSIREGRNYYTGEYCREYRSVMYFGNRTEDTTGIACSRPDGSWYESKQTDVRFNAIASYPAPQPVYAPVAPRPLPAPPVQSVSNGTAVQVQSISRRSGGEWVRLTLNQPVSVARVEVRALTAGIVIHAATVYLASGRQLPLRELSETQPFYAGDTAVSEGIYAGEPVVAIDVRAESMGGSADIIVKAVGANVGASVTRY